MNSHGVSDDDISAVLDQGDYLDLLQSMAGHKTDSRPARETRPVTGGQSFPRTTPPKSRPDGRPVGAWPAGCGRPGSPTPHQTTTN
jgi:hypothetical protein